MGSTVQGNRDVVFQKQDGQTCKRLKTDAAYVFVANPVQPGDAEIYENKRA